MSSQPEMAIEAPRLRPGVAPRGCSRPARWPGGWRALRRFPLDRGPERRRRPGGLPAARGPRRVARPPAHPSGDRARTRAAGPGRPAAAEPLAHASPPGPPSRENADALLELAALLRSDRRLYVRGIARLDLLLIDGAGPGVHRPTRRGAGARARAGSRCARRPERYAAGGRRQASISPSPTVSSTLSVRGSACTTSANSRIPTVSSSSAAESSARPARNRLSATITPRGGELGHDRLVVGRILGLPGVDVDEVERARRAPPATPAHRPRSAPPARRTGWRRCGGGPPLRCRDRPPGS